MRERARSFAVTIWGTPLMVILSALVHGQGVIAPELNRQFTDSNGFVIGAGRVYSCLAGTSCPGNPTPTYTTSSLSTPHSNPIILDAAGRPPGGQIWLSSSVSYKFVVTNSAGTIIAGAGGDNIVGGSGGGGGGGGGSSQWTTSSTNIYNANAGNVGIGSSTPGEKLDVVGNARVKGTFYISNSDSTPRTVGFLAPSGMGSNLTYTLPGAYPASSGYVLSSTTGGNLSWVANGGGGGGGGAANPFATSVGAVTSLAIDVTALNLTSINPALIQCWSGTTTRSPLAITNFTTTGSSPITTVTPTFSSTANVTCQVNSNGGDSSLWSLSSNEVTLNNGSYRIPSITFEDLTASTGATAVVFKAGPGQLTVPLTTWQNNAGTAVAGIDKDGNSIFTSVISSGNLTVGGNTTLSSLASGVLKVDGSGVIGLVSGSGSDCVKVDGTSGTCGGGGSSLPVSDSTSIVQGSVTSSKQLRFEVDGFSPSSIRVLTPQDASYTIAGLETAQTFTSNQTFGGNILASASGKNIGEISVPFSDSFITQGYFENVRIAAAGSSFATTFRLYSSTSNVLDLRNSSPSTIQTWDCSASPCYNRILGSNLSVRGTSGGSAGEALFTLVDTGTVPRMEWFYSTSNLAATWKVDATHALNIFDSSSTSRFQVFQNGNVQVGGLLDQGVPFYVAGNAVVNGNLTVGSCTGCGGGGSIPAWTSYTPTFTAVSCFCTISVSNINAAYYQFGKSVMVRISADVTVTSGSFSAMTISLPVTAKNPGTANIQTMWVYWQGTPMVSLFQTSGTSFLVSGGNGISLPAGYGGRLATNGFYESN